MKNTEKTMDKIVALCKNRGFVFPGSEIYGGLANTWDYGPLGAELKKNIKNAWWKKFVQENPYNVGLDAAILMNPQTWVASGHLGGFSDPLMDCRECHERFRADKVIEDYCADDISTGEARQLIEAVQAAFGGGEYDFYTGVSYRHCLIWHGGTTELGNMTPPHDITGKVIGPHLSTAETARPLLEMMEKSFDLLKDHPVNKARVAAGHRPANCIWLWGEGKRPALQPFEALYGIKGGMVSAVDLLKGIANCAGMEVTEVPGATGYIDTDFEGKAKAALDLLTRNDLVYVHFEAPDECGHRNEPENKVKAIEMIDSRVLPILEEGLEQYEDYKILLLPDHPTPIVTRTHASDPVPYLLYQKSAPKTGVDTINEETAKATGIYMENGPAMMPHFLGQDA